MFLAKLDPSGNVLWANAVAIGPGEDTAHGVAVGGDGQITVGGTFADSVSFGGIGGVSFTAKGKTDLFVARFDAGGNLLWVSPAGSDAAGLGGGASGLAVDSSGNSFVAGQVGPNASFGSLSLAGKAGSAEAFVAKLDPAGKFVWATSVPGEFAGRIRLDPAGNTFVSTGFLVPWPGTLGPGYGHATISKLDPQGTVLWTRVFPGDGTTVICSLLAEASGSVSFAGGFTGTALFGTTVLTGSAPSAAEQGFLARLDSSGHVVHAEQVIATGHLVLTQLARDSTTNLYAVGGYSGAVDLGGTALHSTKNGSSSTSDLYVWNRGPEPY